MAIEQEIQTQLPRIEAVFSELGKVVVGQRQMANRLLVGLLTNGHVLLEGVPGLAKTLTVSTLARVLDLHFSRIQFTPDLLPSDVLGTLIYNPREAKFETRKGPVFANLVLADEINRSPAKVQSALLEAMQEKQVTIGDETFQLPKPFLVLATQNPVDQEGTYPLPEAQVDRFMLKIDVGYPTREEELLIMRRMAGTGEKPEVRPVLTREEIFSMRRSIDAIQVSERLQHYIVDIVIATRNPESAGLPQLKPYIEFGASPRASIAMNLAARAVAFMNGRAYCIPEDIKEVAADVLSHRMLLTFEAEADNLKGRDMVAEILQKMPI